MNSPMVVILVLALASIGHCTSTAATPEKYNKKRGILDSDIESGYNGNRGTDFGNELGGAVVGNNGDATVSTVMQTVGVPAPQYIPYTVARPVNEAVLQPYEVPVLRTVPYKVNVPQPFTIAKPLPALVRRPVAVPVAQYQQLPIPQPVKVPIPQPIIVNEPLYVGGGAGRIGRSFGGVISGGYSNGHDISGLGGGLKDELSYGGYSGSFESGHGDIDGPIGSTYGYGVVSSSILVDKH